MMKATILLVLAAFEASKAICPSNPCFTWGSPIPGLDAPPHPVQLSNHHLDGNCVLPKLPPSHDISMDHPLLEKLSRTFGLPVDQVKTVPVIENHVGHKIVKVIRHVPVLVKETKPELVVRTHHVPILKHLPVTEKCIRNVERPVIHKVPVIHKTIKPYTYQTVRHVQVPANPCCPSLLFSQPITGLPLKHKFMKAIQSPQQCLNDILTLSAAPPCA